jgi:hypothetical protein
MSEEKYSALKGVVTPEIEVFATKEGVTFEDGSTYLDADDELKEIAKYIKVNLTHNSEINPDRIKYLYTTESKKDGGRFVVGQLIVRKEMEKMVNNDYDYILVVFYKVWKELDMEHRVLQLDKLLCGVDTGSAKSKKYNVDSKEYINNMRHFGAESVLKSTEIVDMAISRILDEEKEEKKEGKKEKHNDAGEGE